jgi:hypothetical protein
LLDELRLLLDPFHILIILLSWRGFTQRWSIIGKTASWWIVGIVACEQFLSVIVEVALTP